MCAVSMVTDYWQKNDQWKYNGIPSIPGTPGVGFPTGGLNYNPVSRAEFEQLRKEMMELKELLKAAKAYDDLTNQHKCEKEENVKVLRRIAKALDVNLDDIFEEKSE
jgi:hypothetical protein